MSISDNLALCMRNIALAAENAGRCAEDIALVGATKMNDAARVQEAISAGLAICGENRVQELVQKNAEGAYNGAQLHFIGHLQRNKVRQVVGKAALIQSVGSDPLLDEIEKQASRLNIVQDILLEVNVGGEEAKSGFAPEATFAAAQRAKELAHVRVRGLMTVPPIETHPGENLANFEKVRGLYVDINQKLYDNMLDTLSMGMSGDYPDAIRAGATMVRVGTAIFGRRAYPAAQEEETV